MSITIRRRTLYLLGLVAILAAGVFFVLPRLTLDEDDTRERADALQAAEQVVKLWLTLDYRESPDAWLARLEPLSTEAGRSYFELQAAQMFPQLVSINYVAAEVLVDDAAIIEPIPGDYDLTGYAVAVTAHVRAAGTGLSSDAPTEPQTYRLVMVNVDGQWLFQGPAPETMARE